jgi:putative peptidoglycan lipid II flippase
MVLYLRSQSFSNTNNQNSLGLLIVLLLKTGKHVLKYLLLLLNSRLRQPMLLKLPSFLLNNTKWLEKQQNTILSAAFIITIFNLASAIFGILRMRVFVMSFYDTQFATKETLEALIVAFQIPETMYNLIVSGAISAAFIPVFVAHKKHHEGEAHTMMTVVLNWLLLVMMLVSIPIMIWAEPFTRATTGANFTAEQVQTAATLTRLLLLPQLFFAVSSFFSAFLQSYQRFIMPALAPALYNFGIILGTLLLSPWLGIYSAAAGALIGAILHMSIQLPFVLKLGFRYRLTLDWRIPGVSNVFKLMGPRVLSISVSEMRNLGFRIFTTAIGNSSILIMQLGLYVMTAPIRLLGVPISQASLPFLSEVAAQEDRSKFNDLIVQSLHQIAFLIMPASALVLILRVPIVRLLYGTRNFPWEMTTLSGNVVGIIAFSIAVQAFVQLLIRAFYALKDTRTPFKVAIFDMILYLFIASFTTFVLNWGVRGIAFATTFSAVVEFILIAFFLDRKTHCFRTRAFIIPQLKILLTSFFMAVFLYLPFRILDELVFNTSRTIELISLTVITGTIGLMVYIYFSALFEVRELQFFLNLVTSFGLWRKPLEQSGETLVEAASEGEVV